MSKKKSRKSRKSLGREGSPMKARTSTGMRRLLNQYEAFLKGKNVSVAIPPPSPAVSRNIWENGKFVGVEKNTVTVTLNMGGGMKSMPLSKYLETKGYKGANGGRDLPDFGSVSGEQLWGRNANKSKKR